MSSEPAGGYDDGYAQWKSWEGEDFGRCDATAARYYGAELRRAGVTPGAGTRVLEVGFGNGAFMAWARDRGAQVTGTEVSELLVRRATAAGFDAHLAPTLAFVADGSVDLVVAFDVLEHLEKDGIVALLREVGRVLSPTGQLIARFPNGDSPLGLANQFGDVTHLTFIGSEKARYLARAAGLDVVAVAAPAVSVVQPGAAATLYNAVMLPVRRVVAGTVKLVFFPTADIQFFSSNLVLRARRPVG